MKKGLDLLIFICVTVGLYLTFKPFTPEFDLRGFYYFTNLSNFGVFIFYGISLLTQKYDAKAVRSQTYTFLKFVMLMCITLTGLVYLVLLAPRTVREDGWPALFKLSNVLIHMVVPLLTLIDWGLDIEKYQAKLSYTLGSAIFPIVYLVLTEIRAAAGIKMADGTLYPYFFLNPAKAGGSVGVVIYVVVLTIFFMLMGVGILKVSTLRKNFQNKVSI